MVLDSSRDWLLFLPLLRGSLLALPRGFALTVSAVVEVCSSFSAALASVAILACSTICSSVTLLRTGLLSLLRGGAERSLWGCLLLSASVSCEGWRSSLGTATKGLDCFFGVGFLCCSEASSLRLSPRRLSSRRGLRRSSLFEVSRLFELPGFCSPLRPSSRLASSLFD